MLRAGLCAAVLVVVIVSAVSNAHAESTNLQLEIAKRPCTLDILATGSTQVLAIHPLECQRIPEVQKEAEEADQVRRQRQTNISQSTNADTQKPGLLETTVLQPLASLFGFGESQGSPVRPLTTSATFIAATGIVIDTAFFKRRFTRRMWRGIRTTLKKLYQLVGGVLHI